MWLTLRASTPNSSTARNAVGTLIPSIRRRNIRHVADNEQFARTRIKNNFRGYPRMAAADHHDLRRLSAFGEAQIAILFMTQSADGKGAVWFDQLLWKWHGTRCCERIEGHTIMPR